MALEVLFGFCLVLFFIFGYSGEGSVNFLYLFKEQAFISVDSLYSFHCFYFVDFCTDFYYFFFYHGLGLDLVCSRLIKFLSCIFKSFICAGEGILPWLLLTVF